MRVDDARRSRSSRARAPRRSSRRSSGRAPSRRTPRGSSRRTGRAPSSARRSARGTRPRGRSARRWGGSARRRTGGPSRMIAFCSSVFSIVRRGGYGHAVRAPRSYPLVEAESGRELRPRRRRAPPAGARSRWSSCARDGARREWTLRRGRRAPRARWPARSHARGVRRGDVVHDADRQPPGVGARRWSRASARAPSCCRAPSSCAPKDLRAAPRRRAARARRRRRAQRADAAEAAGPAPTLLGAARRAPVRAAPPPAAELDARGPVPDHLHQRHRRRAQGRRCTASATSPASACRPSTGSAPAPGELVWCTAAERLVEVGAQRVHRALAARRRGAAARRALRPARAPGAARARARRRAVHGADRVPRDRQARRRCARCRRCAAWSPPARRSTPRSCAPGTRRPACGSATATARPRPASSPARRWARRRGPGSMGRPLPGVDAAGRRRRARRSTRATVPTFFLRYLGDDGAARRARGAPATASTQDEDGFLYFEGRTDDVIISAGYRIGPFEVESALVAHPAVAEAAVVAAPDDERGAVVRAVVVLRDGHAPSRRARARAAGPRQGADRALQVPAHRRLRRRAAQDGERQGPPRGAAGPRSAVRAPTSVVPPGRGVRTDVRRRARTPPSPAGSARRRRRRSPR